MGKLIVALVGLVEAIYLARFVLRLMAARPDNPVVAGILAISAPARAPLAMLDAGQPQFGAALEFSTLLICVLIPIVWAIVARSRGPRTTHP
jgi:YggT family protein